MVSNPSSPLAHSRGTGTSWGPQSKNPPNPRKPLLFGEIPSSPSSYAGSSSTCWNTTSCNLVYSKNKIFLEFWHSNPCLKAFFSQVDNKDMHAFRLVCHAFANNAAPYLFKDITVTFKAGSFTKPGRMIALERIGCHVKSLKFQMPHDKATFLPPLVDPVSGEQIPFVYTPGTDRSKTSDGKAKLPMYGSWEVTELMIQQYPPLFHAAANVSSFIRALSSLPSLTHLIISCPGQELSQHYYRSSVDYALISLRVAVEKARLVALDSLSLLDVYPAALEYLHPNLSPSSTPNSSRRWMQIKNLSIEMSGLPFAAPNRSEHLRILRSYLCFHSPTISRLSFSWLGPTRGPCPLSIEPDALYLPYTLLPSPPSLASSRPPRALKFPNLQYLLVENAICDSSGIGNFTQLHHHSHSVHEFVYGDITLHNAGRKDVLSSRPANRDTLLHRVDSKMSMDVPCFILQKAPQYPVEDLRIIGTLVPQDQFRPMPIGRRFARWLEKRRNERESSEGKQ